jgi:hypothetical protein
MTESESVALPLGDTPMKLEATPGFEPGVKVLQTSALPLGYVAVICGVGGGIRTHVYRNHNPGS